MDKEYLVRILKCINDYFDDFPGFQTAMQDLAMDLFRTAIFDNYDIYNYGVLLYASLHLEGVKMIVE